MHSSIVCIHVYPPRKVCTVTLLMVWDIHNIITIPINILDYKKWDIHVFRVFLCKLSYVNSLTGSCLEAIVWLKAYVKVCTCTFE